MTPMAFVRNAWYVANWASEVGSTPHRRTVLGEDIVLYRISNGDPVALSDRCPHRFLPLSQGEVRGDEIRCGYHGLVFDRTGHCTHAPGEETIPPNARVASYPVADRMGLTWVWMGAPEQANPDDIYDLPHYHDPAWGVGHGDALQVDANYLLLCDNLCDPSHVVYVHPTTLGVPGEKSEKVTYNRADWGVETSRWTLDGEPIAFLKAFGNFQANVDRWQFYLMHVPSVAIIDFGGAAAGSGAREGRRDDCVRVFSCHFMTPETDSTTFDYWLHVRNFAPDDDGVTDGISDQFRIAFAEDKVVLEAIQTEEERHGTRGRVGLDLDGSAGLFRRMVTERIRDEAVANNA
jgi:vanillate O-demethylase monooxygenase subunit